MKSSGTTESGQIFYIHLPQRVPPAHEQSGKRPCVVIANPSTVHELRYPMLIVAPLTTKAFSDLSLYPLLEEGVGGLPEPSTVLLDQLTAIDAHRVEGYIGALTKKEFSKIKKSVMMMFK